MVRCHFTVKVLKGYGYRVRVSGKVRVSSISTGCDPLAATGKFLRQSSFTC